MKRLSNLLRLLICLIALMAFAARAPAHPVSLSRGVAEIFDDHITVTVEAPAEDLIHLGLLMPDESNRSDVSALRAAAGQYARMQRDQLVVRDVYGATLAGQCTAVELKPTGPVEAGLLEVPTVWLETRLRYGPLPAGASPIYSFQYAPAGPSASLLTRIGMVARFNSHGQLSHFTLTSGRNVETIELPDQSQSRIPAAAVDARSWLRCDRFKVLHGIVRFHGDSISIVTVVPVPLATTWAAVERQGRDSLTVGEQQALCADWGARFAKAMEIIVDGASPAFEVEGVRVIAPDVSESDRRQMPRTVGFHTARLVAEIRVPITAGAESIKLHWKLFNDAVLVARVLVFDGDQPVEHTIGMYAPCVRLR